MFQNIFLNQIYTFLLNPSYYETDQVLMHLFMGNYKGYVRNLCF
jgi:hypothetical protein